jgi:hypothetical protein
MKQPALDFKLGKLTFQVKNLVKLFADYMLAL